MWTHCRRRAVRVYFAEERSVVVREGGGECDHGGESGEAWVVNAGLP